MTGKKGLSNIVATIALVLLTFAALAVIATFIVPFVRQNLDSGSECFNFKNHFSFEEEFGYNCYFDSPNRVYLVSVRGGSLPEEEQSKLIGLKLAFIEEGSVKTFDIINGSSASSEIAMLSGGVIRIPKSGEVRTYNVSDSGDYEALEVYPILTSGRVCDVNDKVVIVTCAQN